MPLWIRRIIYWSFIALFLLVAPVLALYSMGYRYHWGKHRLERTGLLMVNGSPRDAQVHINGELVAPRLPARIGGLGENEYLLRIDREGFHPWEHRVAVTSGRTTAATDIVLFRDAPPELAIAGKIPQAGVSADGAWFAFIRAQEATAELWIVNLMNGERTIAMRASRPIRTFAWSPRGALLLVVTDAEVLTVNPDAASLPRSLAPLFPQPPSSLTWELGSANTLSAVHDGRLSRVHLLTGRVIPLPLAVPRGPFAIARHVLFSSNADGSLAITPTDGRPTTAIPIGGAAITAFVDLRGSALSVETASRQILEIDTASGTVRTRSGQDLRWNHDGDARAWRDGAFELWEESGDPPQPRLLARRNIPIAGYSWLPTGPYLFLATARDLTAIDRSAPARAPTPLATFDALQTIAVDRTGTTLLIVGRRGATEGLWSLPLR